MKRSGDIRWSSHFDSIYNLIRLFDTTYSVLESIKNDGSNYKTKGDAVAALKRITFFEFIFILHLIKEIIDITDIFCQSLQQKS